MDNPLISPSIGLIFWTTVTFFLLLILLRKFAWKPILNAVKTREESIENSLAQAEKAREEMKRLNADNEKILIEARQERDKVIKEAREISDKMVADAKEKAQQEGAKQVAQTREQIQNEKMAALVDLKNQVAQMSIEIAEKVLRQELDNKENQKELVERQLQDFKLN